MSRLFQRSFYQSGQKNMVPQVKIYRRSESVHQNEFTNRAYQKNPQSGHVAPSKPNYFQKRRQQEKVCLYELLEEDYHEIDIILQCDQIQNILFKQKNNMASNFYYQNTNKNKLSHPHQFKDKAAFFSPNRAIPLLSNHNANKMNVLYPSNNKQNFHLLGNFKGQSNAIKITPNYKIQAQNQQQFLEENYSNRQIQEPSEIFVFNPGNYCNNPSNKRFKFEETFSNYERKRSQSRSNSKNKDQMKFGQDKKVDSEIRIGTINPKSMLSKLNSNSNSNSRHSGSKGRKSRDKSDSLICDDSDSFNQTTYQMSRKAVHGSVFPKENNNFSNKKIPLISKNNNQTNLNNEGARKQSQFSFQRKMPIPHVPNNQNYVYEHQNSISSFKYNSHMLSPNNLLLHTIQQVQQSIKSVQLPQNDEIDSEINRKINQHFEQIKKNMLKQLIMRSKEGNHLNNQSMSLIVDELQHAANTIMQKYCQKQVLVSLKKGNTEGQHKLEFSITESIRSNKKNTLNLEMINSNHFNESSINPPIKHDICGSDQKTFLQKFLPQTQSKSNMNQPAKKEENVQQNDTLNLIQPTKKYQHQTQNKQVEILQEDKMKSLKYQNVQKDLSSISSIHQQSSLNMNVQSNKNSNSQTNENNKTPQPEKNKDSFKKQLQSLNRYTFLKAQKLPVMTYERVYKYQEKELSEKDYKVEENPSANGFVKTYTVKYDVKILSSPQKEERKPTQVYRLSPFKFKNKQQVIQQMVRTNFITKQSESIVVQQNKRA